MTILSSCLLLHQFWCLFDTSSPVFHSFCHGSFQPVQLCRQHAWVLGSVALGQGRHSQGRLRICPQTPQQSSALHVTSLSYGLDLHHLKGTLLIRGRLLLQTSREIKTTMAVTGSPSYPFLAVLHTQFIFWYISVKSLSPLTRLQPVSMLSGLWCHTCRSGVLCNNRMSQVPWNTVVAIQKTSTPVRDYLNICMGAFHIRPLHSVYMVKHKSGS